MCFLIGPPPSVSQRTRGLQTPSQLSASPAWPAQRLLSCPALPSDHPQASSRLSCCSSQGAWGPITDAWKTCQRPRARPEPGGAHPAPLTAHCISWGSPEPPRSPCKSLRRLHCSCSPLCVNTHTHTPLDGELGALPPKTLQCTCFLGSRPGTQTPAVFNRKAVGPQPRLG